MPAYNPIFLLFLLFIIVFAGIFILLFSLGHFAELRLRGLIPTFITSTLIILFLLDLICKNEKIRSHTIQIPRRLGQYIFVIGLILIFSNSSNVKNAYTDIFSGNAKEAAIQSEWIQNYLKNTQVKIISVPLINRKTKTLYTFWIPDAPSGWYHWVVAKYFNKEKILIDFNHSFNDFVTINSNTTGILLYKKNRFLTIKDYTISDLRNKKDVTIMVKAESGNIMPDSKSMLVFEASPLWKGFLLKDIVDFTGHINFAWKFPVDSVYNTDLLKVYFFNPNEDIVIIKSCESEILE